MRRFLQFLLTVLALSLEAASLQGAEPARWTLSLDVSGSRIEGMPLIWSTSQVQLLTRDGRLWSFNPSEAKSYRKSSSTFQSYPTGDIRERLSRELGTSFEVTGTGHFLVAHPRGQRDVWSPRFEQLYNSFQHYFNVRGFNLSAPEFPLVAIVWRNQADFFRYATSDDARIGPGTLGYYSPKSNRITLYDVSGGDSSDGWQQNADTIIHEATHQTAFNRGLHRRFAFTPRWLVEGLATMFEARGVWNSRQYKSQADRINAGRLKQFRGLAAERKPISLSELIRSDRLFETDVNAAYANAWALTFFLVETQPQNYSKYLAKTSQRPPFEEYSATDRVADFTAIFGSNFSLLEARFMRYMDDLK